MAAQAAASTAVSSGTEVSHLKRRRLSNGGIGDEDAADNSLPCAQRPRLTEPVVRDENDREKWRSQIRSCFNTYTSLLSLVDSPDAATLQSLIERANGGLGSIVCSRRRTQTRQNLELQSCTHSFCLLPLVHRRELSLSPAGFTDHSSLHSQVSSFSGQGCYPFAGIAQGGALGY
jgi:hypothetical protein